MLYHGKTITFGTVCVEIHVDFVMRMWSASFVSIKFVHHYISYIPSVWCIGQKEMGHKSLTGHNIRVRCISQ